MPTYEYQCPCGLKFDGSAKLADRAKPKKCPECSADASPVVPSQVQGHFSKEVTGYGPQNTGIHGLDAHIDRVIGQSAKQGWDVAQTRLQEKRDVLATNPGATGRDLSLNLDGGYRVLKPEERGVHERSQAIHSTAMKLALEEAKKETAKASAPR